MTTIVSYTVTGVLSYLLAIVSNNSTIINIRQNLFCNTYWREYSRKLVARTTGNILSMMSLAVTNWFSLHTIYGLHVDKTLCGSYQNYDTLFPFAYQQVAYELYFIVPIIKKFGNVWVPVVINFLGPIGFCTF